jgi:hypothetical protein
LKLLASGIALVVNGVQLSEVADARGSPIPGLEDEYRQCARLVAFEGVQLRKHVMGDYSVRREQAQKARRRHR